MKKQKYNEAIKCFASLIDSIDYEISILSNTTAFLNEVLDNINFVGFYLNKNNNLIIGPFQGKVSCSYIPFSKGVCGLCATKEETIIVSDVHKFEGHIACDSASNSEICVPIMVDNNFYGLLDVDSFMFDNFDLEDKLFLEECMCVLAKKLFTL